MEALIKEKVNNPVGNLEKEKKKKRILSSEIPLKSTKYKI